MGLDQYAYRTFDGGSVEQVDADQRDLEEIAYWRKHPNLQGWMENLWRSKGNEGEFNCVMLELESEDLDNLFRAVTSKDLPETEGFFFGGPSDDYYHQEDLEFIQAAKDAIDDGDKVYYSSWW